MFKDHLTPSAAKAALVAQAVRGVEVFGGIVLNHSVGGINPAAVEAMALTTGQHGKVVWLPTVDAENHVKQDRRSRRDVTPVKVFENGKPVAALLEIFELCRRYDLVLATGHVSVAESLMITKAALRAGVNKVLVTHATDWPIFASVEEIGSLVDSGAFVELALPIARNGISHPDIEAQFDKLASAFVKVGAQHLVLSSDLGQPDNPPHVHGLARFVAALEKRGVPEKDIERAIKTNPAYLLGLTK